MSLVRRVTVAGALLLGLFHGWLFASQVWTGELADPGLVARWIVAFGLIGALTQLRRRGHSMLLGRQAVAVWLLAALLHAPGVIERLRADDAPALPEVVVSLTQSLAAGAVAVGLVLLAIAGLRRAAPATTRGARSIGRRPVRRRAIHASLHFAPRPPPVR